MSVQPAALFTPRWEVFWATTYSFELELFDEYLFRRLGEPPLNATVLVDFATLARTWGGIEAGEEWRVQRVNRLYLVRSAGRPQGRFHPKTYFFGNAKEGTLLVGSGNLSLPGLEEGKEVFSRFDSADQEGLAAILAWRDWMKSIIDQSADEMLGQRWWRLLQTTKEWFKGSAGPSSFVTNADASFLDQLVGSQSSADELHVTAPFFDKDVDALSSLLERLRPEQVSVYLGRGASVDGAALRKLLKKSPAKVSVFAYDPPRFVHAKLVAVIKGKRARLLSGSANLSRAALTSSMAGEAWANIEAGVLSEATAQEARDLFQPPDLETMPVSLDDLGEFSFDEGDAPPALPVRLLSARPGDGETVEVFFTGQVPSTLYLTSPSASAELQGNRTAEAFPLGQATVLLWLTDESGNIVSNRVPLDDPQRLRLQLEKPSAKASDRPRELDAADMQTPIAKVLARLHNECIFDIDELESVQQAERANEESATENESSDFWERLAREELQVDARAGAYRRFGRVGATFDIDEVLMLLRMMLDRTPEQRHSTSGSVDGAGSEELGKGLRWTPTQRLQVRLMNVMTRWARALADPRMNWLQPYSSVRNAQALAYALAELWELHALPEPKLKLATHLVLGNFVRSEVADGYMHLLPDDERKEAMEHLLPEGRDVITALAYLGLRPKSEWEGNIFEWQAWLRPCLALGVVEPTPTAAKLAARILGEELTNEALAERLNWARDYIDDPRWCREMQRLCGINEVRFSSQSFFQFELVIEVDEHDLLDQPGIVCLIRNALDFRRADGLVIMAGPERIAVHLGEKAAIRTKDGEVEEPEEPVTEALLGELEEQGLPLREVLDRDAAAAS